MFSFRRLCNRKSINNVLNCPKTAYLHTFLSNSFTVVSQPGACILHNQDNLQKTICRHKGKGSFQKKEESPSTNEEKSEDDFLENIQDKNTKTLKVNVTSMRMDGILKAGLGLARNKIEVLFYESKIRLNGKKILKKSAHIEEGDEIDVIKGVNMNNPEFLTVARVEVLSVVPKEESLSVKLRRCKSLTIENYKEKDKWTP